ncbi:MAG: L-threonylcarbamoyladenylate synthase [Verrucomicrobiota bacterium]|nr:L-threonylcarbamoyladenylate synthase [Verrucomicrobiota bacterium]
MSHACKILQASAENIDLCADLLRDEAVVGVPTETVYGLAGNALKEVSLRKIFEVKGRPMLDPLIVHFSSIEQAEIHAEFNEHARALAAQFWPGALTLVLPKKDTISDLVTAALPSVAVRVPEHLIFRSLLEQLDFPLAVPSANPFGYVSPTLAEHVASTLGDRILAVIDGGACKHGVESTIVDLRDPDSPKILRPGPLSADQLGMRGAEVEQSSNELAQVAPGMLTQHYSPNTPITLFGHHEQPSNVQKLEAVLYNTKPAGGLTKNTYWLSESGDLTEIAHNLFMLIQKLDARDYTQLRVERAEHVDIGIAVNDRLSRAAAKR